MPIGIDIGSSAVRAAEVTQRRGGSVVLQRYGEIPLPAGAVADGEIVDPSVVGDALRALWQHVGLRGRAVALGLSSPRITVRQFDLPDLPDDELRAAVRFQAADQLPFPVEGALLDFLVVERYAVDDRQNVRVLLVAAEQERVDALLAAAESAKLRPVLVDLDAFALVRSLAGAQVLPDTELIVDVGAAITTIVLHRGGSPLFVRMLRLGGGNVTRKLQQALDLEWDEAEQAKLAASSAWAAGAAIDPDDQRAAALRDGIDRLVGEIERSRDYAMDQYGDLPLRRVVLVGGGSLVPTLEERLEGALNVAVDRGQPLDVASNGNDWVPADAVGATATAVLPVAYGLALGLLP